MIAVIVILSVYGVIISVVLATETNCCNCVEFTEDGQRILSQYKIQAQDE